MVSPPTILITLNCAAEDNVKRARRKAMKKMTILGYFSFLTLWLQFLNSKVFKCFFGSIILFKEHHESIEEGVFNDSLAAIRATKCSRSIFE
jgi:hypothetical protein